MRGTRLLLPPVLVLACLVAAAQPALAGNSSASDNPSASVGVRLGDSFVALTGPWKFAPGESPGTEGNLLWASPAFDDTAWSKMDLHAKPGETDAAYGSGGYVMGWSARGFPDLVGFAWYRLRVHVASSTGPLSLKMPDHVDDAYQVFANGRFLGQFGDFKSSGVVCYRSRPLTFALPAPDANGDILLAIRFYMEPWVIVIGASPDSGGMHQAPLLGLRSSVDYIRAQEVTGRLLTVLAPLFLSFAMLIAATGAFWIWLLDRPRATYLWLTLALVLAAAPAPLLSIGFFSYALTQDVQVFLLDVIITLNLICWILFWRHWFQLGRNRWSNLLMSAIGATLLLSQAFGAGFFATHISAGTILGMLELKAVCNAAFGFLLFVTLLQGLRKDRTGALVALPPILLLAISIFSNELLDWFRIRTSFFPFGVDISVADIASILLVLVVGALVARRFIGSQVSQRLERQTIDQDLEQASELQQRVLIPEPVTSSLFTVESAYHPARSVGGDFFQVIAHADGSLLIVVGDVSGKGIAAAMLVAVLVGAIRTRAEETFDPAAILQSLNDRLLGRAGDHFATCIAAQLRPGGTMLVANAGHIPPYRNGVALDLPGSMPLGIIPGTQYDVHAIQLDPADYLTFVTDGVLEARNTAGQLLGFDQLAELSSLPAEAIAQAAITHGQDDDITIVSVRFCAAARAMEGSPILETSPI
jgi:hypothetical protein